MNSLRPAVPRISIDTGGVEVEDKSQWVPGTIVIEGYGEYPEFVGEMEIRGRGNSTWTVGAHYGKKPFRVRLAEGAALLDLGAERNWVLLASYLDGTLMANATSFAIAHLLELPFTHHMIPVDIIFNDEYIGQYLFTEHKEVTPNRIAIGEGDLLLELDTNFDEDYQFVSEYFELPVMIQHPSLDSYSEPEAEFAVISIREVFAELELAITDPEAAAASITSLLDPQAFAKFMVVFYLTANRELNLPNSVLMYKIGDGPFQMGPIWDFDRAYGYNTGNRKSFVNPTIELLLPQTKGGGFFLDIVGIPEYRHAIEKEWARFREDLYPVLVEYVSRYAEIISESYERDFDRWHETDLQFARSADFDGEVRRILQWLDDRVEYLDGAIGSDL